ncbi:MAG: PAC2 family protein, partial [Actinomycetota bacterium]|nr:PAC2 family protein [Actinomycetota bacterium]
MLEFEDVGTLHDPILIAAFEGWNDAGEAASAAIEHLADVWQAEAVAALDPEDYYDFQVNRPKVVLDDGQRRVIWPTTRLLVARDTGFDRDVVLVEGIEPSTRWRAFTIELLEFAERVGVSTFVTLGALLADVPHTRPIPVTATSDSVDVIHRYDAESSSYEGLTGIVGVLSDAAGRTGLPALSCWAAVPHYAGGSPSPKATLGLIGKLESLFSITIPLGDLP